MLMSKKWFICFASFLIQLTIFGIHNNFGLIFHNLLKAFKQEPAETAWIGSLAMGITFFVSPFSSLITTRIGFRSLIITSTVICVFALLLSSFASNIHWLPLSYSLFWGAGAGFANHASLVLLQQNFYDKLSLANGIATSGSGVGTLILGPLLNYLLTKHSFRWAFRACAVLPLLFLFSLPFIKKNEEDVSNFFFQTPEDLLQNNNNTINSHENQDGINRNSNGGVSCHNQMITNDHENTMLYNGSDQNLNKGLSFLRIKKSAFEEIFNKEIWSNRAYVIFVIGISTFLFGYFIPFVFMIEHATLNGVPTNQAQFLVGILAITATIVKVMSGFILDLQHLLSRKTLFLISMYCMAFSHLIVAFATEYWMFCLYAVVFGICEGCFVGQLAAVIVDVIHCRTQVSIALGNLFAIMSVPIMAGPVVAGKLSGLLHGYKIAFLISASVCFVGALITTLIKLYEEVSTPSLGVQINTCTSRIQTENNFNNGCSGENLVANNIVTFTAFTRSLSYREQPRYL